MIHLFPDENRLKLAKDRTLEYMWPNDKPIAVAIESGIDSDICDQMLKEVSDAPTASYKFDGCKANTKEFEPNSLSYFGTVLSSVMNTNTRTFQYDIDWDPQGAWLQSYGPGDEYDLHSDGTIGGTRKLTAVLMLSEPKDYIGGDLELIAYPQKFVAPRAKGTLIIFPPWLLHRVTPVSAGLRQTINFGFWGPPFR